MPVDFIEKHRCLPLLINGEGGARTLYLGMEDPSDPDVVAEICTLVGMNVQAVLVAPTELAEGIFRHYQCSGFGTEPLSDLPSAAAKPRAAGFNGAGFSDAKIGVPESRPRHKQLIRTPITWNRLASTTSAPNPPSWGLDELGSEDPDGPLEFEDSPALPRDDPTEKSQGASASSDAMLSAIAQLLVEKGVFTREELVKRLRAMPKPEGGA